MLRRALLVLALALAFQAVPSTASGPVVVDPLLRTLALDADQVVDLQGARMVGVTWRTGNPSVQLRWHSAKGWTAWAVAEDDTADSPDGLPGTAPLWRPTGADKVQVRTSGRTSGLSLVRVLDGLPHRLTGALMTDTAHAETGRGVLGAVRSRADWGANESWRRAPRYASRVNAVVVHHTVNTNDYRPQDVPALIRADYAYHVRSRGWADLGYNLLVDKYGGIWEGHAGGLGRATIGTHAQGFNTGTLGVAVIGDLTKTTATPATEKALARVFAYAALTWRFDPAGSVTLTSQGSPRYRSGQRVTLPRVFGHKDTGITACPGSVHSRLGALRALARVAMRPAPRILQPTLSGAPVHAPDDLRLDAKLSVSVPWTARMQSPDGKTVVASARGRSGKPHLQWDGLAGGVPAPPGTYAWVLTADDGFHPVTTLRGRFEVGLPLVPF